MFTPLVSEIRPPLSVIDAFARLRRRPHCVFLDSALRHPTLGRYSFLTADPFEFLMAPRAASGHAPRDQTWDQPGIWDAIQQKLRVWRSITVDDLPPFQGGAAGLFSYDLHHTLEQIPLPAFDEFSTPSLALGFYDVVFAFDHVLNRSWLISQGLPETDDQARRRRAAKRLELFHDWLGRPPDCRLGPRPLASSDGSRPSRAAARWGGRDDGPILPPLSRRELAPQFDTPFPGLTSNFSPDQYLQAAGRVIEYIYAGDVFQVNLAQRLVYPCREDPFDLYLRLRQENPATFSGFFDLGQFQIVSASPERFLRVWPLAVRDQPLGVRDESNKNSTPIRRVVESRPIKGTRRRTSRPEADLFYGDELRASEKDRAENVMIVDLMRNDLSKVCRAGSVRVTQLCELESYQFVQHLVSAVCGALEDDKTPLDLLRGAFPGGSITGAPKVRAMEIIAELEPTARGPYCGSLGYIGFDGAMDMNILIRTITAGRGWLQLPVGGGIVAQSSPLSEYEETWHKARGLLAALKE